MGLEHRGMLKDLSHATKRKMPTCTRRVMLSGFVGATSVLATCVYSALRIQKGEEDFHVLQRTQIQTIGRQVLFGIKRQLQTSVSSTKALSALINFDDGEQLLDAIGSAIDTLGARSQELALQSEDAEATEKQASPGSDDNLTRAQSDAVDQIILNASKLKFNAIADSLISTYRGISYLQLAPGGVISASYPLQGSEESLGTHLLFEPSLRSSAVASISSHSVMFSGPLPLASGKRGIVAYHPTFKDTADFVGQYPDDPSWWGFTGAACYLEDLFMATPLASEEVDDLSYVLYAKISGSLKLLAASDDVPGMETEEGYAATWYLDAVGRSPETTSFRMQELGVEWEMLVWPKAGWQAHSDTFVLQLVLCAFFTICSVAGMYSMLVRESVIQQVAGVMERYAEPTPKHVWFGHAAVVPSSPAAGAEPAWLV